MSGVSCVQSKEKREKNVAKKVGSFGRPGGKSDSVGSFDKPEGGGSFLKAAHIGKGASVKIIGNARPGTGFSDYFLDVKLGKQEFVFGLKKTSGNFRRLFDRFGANPKKWEGKTIKVKPAENMGKTYVQVQD